MQNTEIPAGDTPDGQTKRLNDKPPAKPGLPICSMTGYAHRSEETPLGRISFEIRAVNSRFSDLHFRLADEFRPLEPLLRAAIGAQVKRGKIECRMSLNRRRPEAAASIDQKRLAQLLRLGRQIQAAAPEAAAPTVADYLRWLLNPDHPAGPMMDGSSPQALESGELWTLLQPMVQACLADFQLSRQREGRSLTDTLAALAGQMQVHGAQLRSRLPELQAHAESRLLGRLENALKHLPVPIPAEETFARVRQEISLLSLRDDITEELDRLDTHLQAVHETLAGSGPVGKRLDFLSQELNREANTIASKSMAIEITDTAIALKLLIEQLREQVQNLE